MMHHINFWRGLLDDPSREGERTGGGEDDAAPMETDAAGADHIEERPGFGPHVVVAMRSHNVLVVRTAVERQVAAGRGLTGGVVVGHLVCTQHPVAIIDFGVAAQLVDVAGFLLLARLDDDFFPRPRGRAGGRNLRRIARRRTGRHRRKQLASNYGMRQNQMTNEGSRDT